LIVSWNLTTNIVGLSTSSSVFDQ